MNSYGEAEGAVTPFGTLFRDTPVPALFKQRFYRGVVAPQLAPGYKERVPHTY